MGVGGWFVSVVNKLKRFYTAVEIFGLGVRNWKPVSKFYSVTSLFFG